jgi:mRNA interferase HigB
MKVHLVKRQSIEQFLTNHAPGRKAFDFWLSAIKFAEWDVPEDIRRTFGSTDFLGNGSERVVFNIGGNNYRLVAKYYFGEEKVHLFVMWIGNHAEYDELCRNGNQYYVNEN